MKSTDGSDNSWCDFFFHSLQHVSEKILSTRLKRKVLLFITFSECANFTDVLNAVCKSAPLCPYVPPAPLLQSSTHTHTQPGPTTGLWSHRDSQRDVIGRLACDTEAPVSICFSPIDAETHCHVPRESLCMCVVVYLDLSTYSQLYMYDTQSTLLLHVCMYLYM